ncbi:hypothetical protein P8452_71766 [Trifolium repens]|nr:hypothetical protein P8452_71766 [Trifolium repens]
MSCRVASALRKEPHTSRFKTTKLTVGIYISYTTYENRGFWFCKVSHTSAVGRYTMWFTLLHGIWDNSESYDAKAWFHYCVLVILPLWNSWLELLLLTPTI